jgi:predicted amidohydrolase
MPYILSPPCVDTVSRRGIALTSRTTATSMPTRIALANLRSPATRDESVALAEGAIGHAGADRVDVICFPECFVPGYRLRGRPMEPPDSSFLDRAWTRIAAAARKANVAVVLGTERVVGDALLASALVIDRDGTTLGLQDKVQIDPTEEGTYTHGAGRRVFKVGDLTFGVVICHEGWRYPETVRACVRQGAQVVFHPHYHAPDGGYVPTSFADPRNTFHEKAVLCRAAENTCYVASVNCAIAGSPTTSVVANPDGTVRAYQPYGKEGLLVVELELAMATGLIAARLREPKQV